MMLMWLLTELTSLEVHLSVAFDGLHVQAPSRALTDELRQAMAEHKAALLRYAADPAVETIDGLGYLSGNRREQDVTFVAPERKERLRYKVGVVLLQDGIERFYYPGMLSVGHYAGSDPSP
jgi:TubC N-terminal docking domain